MLKNKQTILFFIIMLISSIALFSISYFHTELHNLIEYIIFISFYIILGKSVFKNAALDFINGKFMRESFLMTIATIGAIFIHELPEALAVLMFYRIGMYFEDKAVNRSRNTIASLVAVRADYANIIKPNGSIEKTSISNVKNDDEIIIYPFEKVPLDCVITNGESWMDTKILTGESMPRTVKVKSEILAGMVNGESQIKAKVIRVYAESSIAKILRLVEDSANRKAKIENFISRFSAVYTPIVVLSSVLLTIIPITIYGREVFNDWFTRSLTLLVVSCPCAFIVGIPLTYFASIGRASKIGIIVKGGVFLDTLSKTKTVIFDKTGTLTKGEFSIKKIYNNNIVDNDTLIKYAAYSEYGSAHPIAKSVVNYYTSKNGDIKTSLIKSHKDISGKGVISQIEGKNILVGGKSLMIQNKINLPEIDDKINVLIAIDNKYAGGLEVDDSIKEDTHSAMLELKKMKVKTAVLSGDLVERVKSFAKEIDIDIAEGGCLPENKVEKLESIMKDSKVSVFVGDGINDAPSLARADVGIAMGGLGSDAAVENADVVIMDDKPSKVASIIKLAQKTNNVVWQNITLAFVVKFLALVLGAMGKAPMWIAILADTGVTVVVVFNAIRILYPFGEKQKYIEYFENKVATSCHCCDH